MPDSRDNFLDLLEKVSPSLRRAFGQAIARLRSVADVRAVEDAIRRGDIEGAVDALNIGPQIYEPLRRAMEQAYIEGGEYQIQLIPEGLQAAVFMEGRSDNALQWAMINAAHDITLLSEDQKQAVRGEIVAGLSEGVHPRVVARNIVGLPEGPATRGGLLGLSTPQAEALRRARSELRGERALSKYLTRDRRDKRFDKAVKRALAEGKDTVPAAMADRMLSRYSDRMLQLRSETIARTEALASLNAGRMEGINQTIAKLGLPRDAVTKIWDATPSVRTRDSHWSLNGQRRKIDEPFESPLTGHQMQMPGDQSLSAPASEIINCRCTFRTEIDYTRIAK